MAQGDFGSPNFTRVWRAGVPPAPRSVLQPEANLDLDLILRHFPLFDAAAHLGHLEPVEVAQGLGRAFHPLGHRPGKGVIRRPDDLYHLVNSVLGHTSPPSALLLFGVHTIEAS